MGEPDNVIPLPTRAPRTPGLSEQPDDELMQLARGGMREAFDVLVRRHQSTVLKVATRQMGDAATAKDVAQCTFIELFRYLPRYQPQGKLKALLHRILLNQCRMAGRSRQSRREEPLEWTPMRERPGEAVGQEEQLLKQEQRKVVEHALQGLSEKIRSVVVLRIAGELSFEEIGEVLDIPVGTVKSRMFAGMEQLEKSIQRLRGDTP